MILLAGEGIPGYNYMWPIQLRWQPYSGHIRMSWSRVATTWMRGSCPDVLAWPPCLLPTGRPLRRLRREIDGIAVDKHPGTYVFFSVASSIFFGVFRTYYMCELFIWILFQVISVDKWYIYCGDLSLWWFCLSSFIVTFFHCAIGHMCSLCD